MKCLTEISGIQSRRSCQRRLQATNGVIYKANPGPARLLEQSCIPGGDTPAPGACTVHGNLR